MQLNIDNFLYPYPTNAPYQIWLRLTQVTLKQNNYYPQSDDMIVIGELNMLSAFVNEIQEKLIYIFLCMLL